MEEVDKEGAKGNGAARPRSRSGSPSSPLSSPSVTTDSEPSGSFSDNAAALRDCKVDPVVPSGTPPRSPTIGTLSTSLLERPPAGYNPNRIPSSVFASRSSDQADWSIASNESLFSIQTGNDSFSTDHTAFLLYKSGELTKLDEVFSVPIALPRVSESVGMQRDSVGSSAATNASNSPRPGDSRHDLGRQEPSGEENSPILGNSSSNERNKGSFSPLGDTRDSTSLSVRSDGSATTTSTSSFAFPVLAGNDKKPSSVHASTDRMTERAKETPPKTPQPPQPGHKTTVRAALSNCFSCFCCCSFRCNFSLK
ncbi:hypothetical protein MLD38_033871 [Melastoma candidum]|uniref:Uncharacterized protein n=1 Tax=Melastoma candidum TaxID=119954 RepID=A0ACB9M7T7_9MYRT|nr:hypothetical protein MLD38_033871 [Melastoma candidum]